jgi:selT/selW/selH-like putative selenoprotein
MDPDSVIFPNIKIDGDNYDVTGPNALIADIIGHLRLVCFFMLFAGDFVFNMLGGIEQMPLIVKESHKYCQENKIQFGLGIFFISSIIQTNLMQSGAFEIYVNGNLEFSKLETKNMPDFAALQTILAKYGVTI